jgi:hypothetical protein
MRGLLVQAFWRDAGRLPPPRDGLLPWWKWHVLLLEVVPLSNKRLVLSGLSLFCFPPPCWPAVAARS